MCWQLVWFNFSWKMLRSSHQIFQNWLNLKYIKIRQPNSFRHLRYNFHCVPCYRSTDESNWIQPRLNPRRVAFIGLRCVDPAERKTLNDLNIPAFSMREIDEFGIREVRRLNWKIIKNYRSKSTITAFLSGLSKI